MLLLCAALLAHASFIYGFQNASTFSTEQSLKYTNITGASYRSDGNSSSGSNKNVTVIQGITYGTTTTKLGNVIYGSTRFYKNRRKTAGTTTERSPNSFLSSTDRPELELSTLATRSKTWQIYNSTLLKQLNNRSIDNTNKLAITHTTIKQLNFTDPPTALKIKFTSNSSTNYSKEYHQSLTTRKPKYSRRTNRFRNLFSNVTTKSSFDIVPSSQQNGARYNTTMSEERFNSSTHSFSTTDTINASLSYSPENGKFNDTHSSSYKSFFINSTIPVETFPKSVPKNVTELYYGPINMTVCQQTTSTHCNETSKKTTNYISENLVPINESKLSVGEGIENTKETSPDGQTITDIYTFTGHNDNRNSATSYIPSNVTLESTATPSKTSSSSSQVSTRKSFTTTETQQYLQSSLINLTKNWTSTTNYLGPEIQNKSEVSFLPRVSVENTTIQHFNLSTVKSSALSVSKHTVSEETTPNRYFNQSTIKSTSVSDSKTTKFMSSSVRENVNSTTHTNLRPLNVSTVNNIGIFNSSTLTTQITANNYNVTRPTKKCDINCQKNEICVFTRRNKKQCVCKPNFERDKNSKICKEVGYSVSTTSSYYSTSSRANSDILKFTDVLPNQEEQNHWVYSFKKWNNLTRNEKLYNVVTITFNEEVEALEWFRNFDLQFRKLIAAVLMKESNTCKDSANKYNYDARNVVYIAPSPVIKNGTSAISFIVESVDKNCTQKYVSGKLIKDILFELNNGTMKMFQLYITSVDIGKHPEVTPCEDNTENALKLVITSVTITAAIASFLVLAILLIKCRQCNKFNKPRVHRYKTWDSKCAFTTGNDLASDIQCVGDEADIVMECNGVKTGKVRELSKPCEKLSVLVHNEEKLELECSTSVKMKFKDKDDTKL